MTTSTHTADTPDTVEAIVSRAILTGQLLPSMRAWALHLGDEDRAALLSFLASVAGGTVATPTTTPDTSSSTTHTPGPWRFDAEQGAILAPDWKPVAFVSLHAADSLAQEGANGYLIAQAPELLHVARLALAELEGSLAPCRTKALHDDLRRVIATAAPGARQAVAEEQA